MCAPRASAPATVARFSRRLLLTTLCAATLCAVALGACTTDMDCLDEKNNKDGDTFFCKTDDEKCVECSSDCDCALGQYCSEKGECTKNEKLGKACDDIEYAEMEIEAHKDDEFIDRVCAIWDKDYAVVWSGVCINRVCLECSDYGGTEVKASTCGSGNGPSPRVCVGGRWAAVSRVGWAQFLADPVVLFSFLTLLTLGVGSACLCVLAKRK